jgi:hypothetical protein
MPYVIVGPLALLLEGLLFFLLQEDEMRSRLLPHMFRQYLAAIFDTWVGKMSGAASIALLFLSLFVDSRILARATWAAAAICFLTANYAAWYRERQRVIEQETQIDRISKPDKCPVVLIHQWRFGAVAVGIHPSTGEPASLPMNAGFDLQNDGEAAYEVTLDEFEVEPSMNVASRMVSHVANQNAERTLMLAWIKDRGNFDKWDLPSALRLASEHRDGRMMWKPDYSCTLHLTYRDHRNFWYRTTQELIYIPASGRIEFGPIQHEKLGLRGRA